MEMNVYAAAIVLRQHQAELRADAQREHLARAVAGPRRPLRAVIGLGLIRLGRWVRGPERRDALAAS